MYTTIQQGDTVEAYVKSVACDTLEDMKTLPTNWKAGSTCIVIENSSVWMLGMDKQWHEI